MSKKRRARDAPAGLRWAKASHKDTAVPHLRFPGLKRHGCCKLQVSGALSALRALCETRRYRPRQDKKHTHWGGGLIKGEREWVAHEKDKWRDESMQWAAAHKTKHQTLPATFTFNKIFTRSYTHTLTLTHGSCERLNTEHFNEWRPLKTTASLAQ